MNTQKRLTRRVTPMWINNIQKALADTGLAKDCPGG
jgi:hypothetical protein